MKNYAEQLAYLYFRLNGFFLIDNYVSHASETDNGYHADNDLLGIRPPNVFELIGQKDIKDNKDLTALLGGKKYLNKYIGIICESKGGTSSVRDLTNNKLKSCINRLGLLNDDDRSEAYKKLKLNDSYCNDKVLIIKILVHSNPQGNIIGYKKLNTKDIIKFIKKRIKDYPEKGRAWNHYGSDILQLILTEHL